MKGLVEKSKVLERVRRIAGLRHPNLVQMVSPPGGAGYLVAANPGRLLADFTAAGTFKRFKIEQVVRLLRDVLAGLSALHADVEDGLPFVHGEVTPQHIYVSEEGSARLVPLVGRHWLGNAQPSPTGYAAPELLIGDPGDPRADLFSVGVMLWEALAGTRLFSDPSLDAVLARLLEDKLPPVLAADASRWARPLYSIAERAIALDPVLRFQSAAELSGALELAIAPHIAQGPATSWRDEAPTLTKQDRPLPLPPLLRTQTPPATVLDLAPHPAAEPPRAVVAPAAKPRTNGARRAEWRRAATVALVSAAVAGVVALLVPLPRPAPAPRAGAPEPRGAAAAVMANPSPAASVASAASAAAPAAASSATSALAPSASASTAAPPPPRERPAAARQRRKAGPVRDADYGI